MKPLTNRDVAIEPGDQVQFSDGGITTVVGFCGSLMEHTGGFVPSDTPMTLIRSKRWTKAVNRQCAEHLRDQRIIR